MQAALRARTHKPLPRACSAAISPPMTTRPDIHAKAETLIEALPYFQRYAGRSFVVKYGGNAMGDKAAAALGRLLHGSRISALHLSDNSLGATSAATMLTARAPIRSGSLWTSTAATPSGTRPRRLEGNAWARDHERSCV